MVSWSGINNCSALPFHKLACTKQLFKSNHRSADVLSLTFSLSAPPPHSSCALLAGQQPTTTGNWQPATVGRLNLHRHRDPHSPRYLCIPLVESSLSIPTKESLNHKRAEKRTDRQTRDGLPNSELASSAFQSSWVIFGAILEHTHKCCANAAVGGRIQQAAVGGRAWILLRRERHRQGERKNTQRHYRPFTFRASHTPASVWWRVMGLHACADRFARRLRELRACM